MGIDEAILIMENERPHCGDKLTFTEEERYEAYTWAIGALKELSSAQPEIIRCEDCKHVQRWRSEESAKKFGQAYECARNVINCPKPDDFCSYAERRTDG